MIELIRPSTHWMIAIAECLTIRTRKDRQVNKETPQNLSAHQSRSGPVGPSSLPSSRLCSGASLHGLPS